MMGQISVLVGDLEGLIGILTTRADTTTPAELPTEGPVFDLSTGKPPTRYSEISTTHERSQILIEDHTPTSTPPVEIAEPDTTTIQGEGTPVVLCRCGRDRQRQQECRGRGRPEEQVHETSLIKTVLRTTSRPQFHRLAAPGRPMFPGPVASGCMIPARGRGVVGVRGARRGVGRAWGRG